VKVAGDDMYVLFLHPRQIKDMRIDATAARVTWYDAQKSAMTGGRVENNPIFTGAQGVYNNTIIHESTRVPHGGSSATLTNTHRAIFCGAQAACMAFGQGFGASRMSWMEELFDYGNQLGVSAGMIAGLKKNVFNSADFGVLTLTTGYVD
jgi:N4-gp56 family major capsid protein